MILIHSERCDFCGTCVAVCPPDAIELLEAEIRIDETICTNCKLCVTVCPVTTLEYAE